MEPLFETQGIMTEERYRRFYLLHTQTTPLKAIVIIMSVLLFVLAAFSLLMEMSGSMIVLVSAGVCLLFWPKLAAKKYASQMDVTARYMRNKPFTLRFFADEIAEFTPIGEQHIRYEDVYRVVENQDTMLIYISASQAFVVFKSEMTRGTAQGLSVFLRCDKHLTYKSK